MYQLRSQIDLFYPYKCNTGVLTGAQFYLKGKKASLRPFSEVYVKFRVEKKR